MMLCYNLEKQRPEVSIVNGTNNQAHNSSQNTLKTLISYRIDSRLSPSKHVPRVCNRYLRKRLDTDVNFVKLAQGGCSHLTNLVLHHETQ